MSTVSQAIADQVADLIGEIEELGAGLQAIGEDDAHADAEAEAAAASATASASSAAAASSSASAAAGSAVAASNSATDASSSASNALQNATSASNSAASAQTYAGNASTAVQAGLAQLSAAVPGFYNFIAAAGQTVWTPPSGAIILPGLTQIYVNGSRWDRLTSFDDSTGSSVTFARGLTMGSSVSVYLPRTVAFPLTGVSQTVLATAASGSGADMVGFLGVNGVATTLSALASTATGKGASLIAYRATNVGAALDGIVKSTSPVLTSIAAVRNLDSTRNQSVFVSGYYQAGDGGGGPFYLDTLDTSSADNQATTIVATDGGRWKLLQHLHIDARQLGMVFDGQTDSTAAFLNAIAVTNAIGYPISLPHGNCVFSGTGVSFPGDHPGMIGLGNFQSGFYFNGTGTGITISAVNGLGVYRDWVVTSGLPGQSLTAARATPRNGIYWEAYGGDNEISNIKASNFNGFGQKFEALWDTVVNNLIVLSCGNDTEYAFSCINGSDSINHSNFNRIQVEASFSKAMYVEGGLNLVFTGIHSERTAGNGTDYTHVFTGDLTLINARIEGTTNVYVQIGIAVGSMTDVKINSGVTDFVYGSRLALYSVMRGCVFQTVNILSTNLRAYHFDDCLINVALTTAYGERDTLITNSYVNGPIVVSGSGPVLTLKNTTVLGTITSAGGNNTVSIDGGSYAYVPTTTYVNIKGATFANPYNTAYASQTVAQNCVFNGLVTISQTNVTWRSNHCQYAAGVAVGAGGPSCSFGDGDFVSGGTATGTDVAPTTGTWYPGQTTKYLNPIAAGFMGSVCVLGGTPGTWRDYGAISA